MLLPTVIMVIGKNLHTFVVGQIDIRHVLHMEKFQMGTVT